MRLRALSGILLAFLVEGGIKAQPAVAFTNVAVVDVEEGSLRLDQTVVIEGSRITQPAILSGFIHLGERGLSAVKASF
jgi:hypothetical protein